MGRKHARWQARCARSGFGRLVQHLHLPAPAGQAGGSGSPGQPATNHQAMLVLCAGLGGYVGQRGRAGTGFPAGVVGGVQVVALGGHAGHALHFKAALGQRIAHGAGNGPGGQLRAPAAAARHGFEGVGAPDVGVDGGAETVEVHRVGRGRLLAQHFLRIAHIQREQHAAFFKRQAVHAGQQAPPLGVELFGQRRQFGVGAGGAQQVGGAHGPGFRRYEVQQARALRVGAPCSPGDEKVQPKAKARFQHPPLGLARPGRRQAAALQKHAAGLVQPPVFTVVAVAKAGAVGGAVGQPVDGLGHGVCKC